MSRIKIYYLNKHLFHSGHGENYEDVPVAFVECHVLNDLDCCGPSTFTRPVPCIHFKEEEGQCKYSFPTAVILSIFVGICGGDRFYLGHTASAVGKLFSLGGLGIWWITDIILLLNGQLRPVG